MTTRAVRHSASRLCANWSRNYTTCTGNALPKVLLASFTRPLASFLGACVIHCIRAAHVFVQMWLCTFAPARKNSLVGGRWLEVGAGGAETSVCALLVL